MNGTISISKLKENLIQHDSPPNRLHDLNEGARYLYEFLYLPMLAGKAVTFGDLDHTRFDRDDIESIYDFHNDREKDTYRLSKVCDRLQQTKAALKPVVFI